MKKTALQRFYGKVSWSSNGCLIWDAGKTPAGYGVFFDRKPVLAHRWIYQKVISKVQYVIDHICKNTSCVNPNHLEDVRQQENIARSDSGKVVRAIAREERRYCKNGHPWAPVLQRRREGFINAYCKICRNEQAKARRVAKHAKQELPERGSVGA